MPIVKTAIRTGILAIAMRIACGCSHPVAPSTASVAMTASQPAIELLGFPDCPNTPVMRDNLAAALAVIGRGWTFAETNQELLPEGDIRRGYATPTVLVDQRDLFGLPVPTGTSLGCRIYPGGVPSTDAIADRIRAVVKRADRN